MQRQVVDINGQMHAVIGAGSGIGRAAAQRLAELGARVVCLDIDGDSAKETALAIEAAGGAQVAALGVDVRDEGSVDSAFDEVARQGPLHGVVNCAGITGETGIDTHLVSPADFANVYAVNVLGAFHIARAAIPAMVECGYGRILYLASISGKDGNAGMSSYSSSKAGLIGLVKVLGKEYATTGVTVNALAPAVIATPMVDALPESQVTYMTEKIPMGRTGSLEEAAAMIAWILSPACSFTTGFTFDLTGGRAVY